MEIKQLLLIFFLGFQTRSVIGVLSTGNGTDSPSETAYLEADTFLTSYGYYPSSRLLPAQVRNPSIRKHSNSERSKALKLFQEFYKLPQSGELDMETTQLMRRPRCGNADITSNVNTMGTSSDSEMREKENVYPPRKDNENQGREESGVQMDREKRSLDTSKKKKIKSMSGQRKRGIVQKWGYGDDMVWYITEPSRQRHLQPVFLQRHIVQRALSIWEPLLPFKFVEKKGHQRADMEIKFHSFSNSSWNDKQHIEHAWRKDKERKIKRPENAPKRKGSHAHAMVPMEKGELSPRHIHLDEDYDWSNHRELLSVLLHEIGHSLGLGHSANKSSVMYPYNRDVTHLSVSDITSIGNRYASEGRKLRRALCDATIREVDNMFEVWVSPQSRIVRLFFIISGHKLLVTTGKRRLERFDRYDEFFIDAPPKYDVVFSDLRSRRIFFVAGNILYVYKMSKHFRRHLKPRTYEEEIFPETPKSAMSIIHLLKNRFHTYLFGERTWWFFEYGNRGDLNISSPMPYDNYSSAFISESKFALQWIDGKIYNVKMNGSWTYYDWQKNNPSPLMMGNPPWMEKLLCDLSASIRTSRPSLLLVIMLILIKLY